MPVSLPTPNTLFPTFLEKVGGKSVAVEDLLRWYPCARYAGRLLAFSGKLVKQVPALYAALTDTATNVF